MSSKLKVAISGATGFIGKYLVDAFIKQGAEIVLLVRYGKKLPLEWNDKVKVIFAEASDYIKLKTETLNNIKSDIFFHFAWNGTSGEGRYDDKVQVKNIEYACDAMRLATRMGCRRFVNAGSIMEYDAMDLLGNNEKLKPVPGYIYSIAKLAADLMCRTLAAQLNIEYINVVISNIYGPEEQSKRFISTVMRKMIRNERIALTHGRQKYDFIYIADAIEEILLAAQNGMDDGIYYIGNREPRTLKEYVIEMKETLGSKSELAFGELELFGEGLSYREFDTRRIYNEFQFVPRVSFPDGIRKIMNAESTEG